jgi:phosphotransferase system enzyme I (PtsI)
MKRRDGRLPGSSLLRGIGAAPGVAIGPAYLFERGRVRTPRYHVPPAELTAETERLQGAFALAETQLAAVQERVEREQIGAGTLRGPREYGLIVEAQRAMLRDQTFIDQIATLIRDEQLNAEWALRRIVRDIKGRLGASEDEYFRERRDDLDFLADRVVRNLLGQTVDLPQIPPDGCILVCHELSPADATILLMEGKVLGLITDTGGRTGHTALVARARNIPAVVGTVNAASLVARGQRLAVDGTHGLVLIEPDDDALGELRAGQEALRVQASELSSNASLPATTTDGVRVSLLGNIEFPEELQQALANGAEGIGLYRTEFLYLNRTTLPSEEEHYRTYRGLLEAAGQRPVTIRTFDLGMDKIPMGIKHREDNPAMGLRGVRFLLKAPQAFRTQLRALLRASPYGNLQIMFPMVSGLTEVREARAQLEAVRAELAREGEHLADRIPIGIMIELPSAAQIADRLARESDFFSIGTNDLIQYSLAMDRQNPEVAYLYQPLHLGVLRMLEFVARSARAAGIPVSMCGEMAADPGYSAILVALGLDSLSMSPRAIPRVKQAIRVFSAAEAKALLAEAMAYSSAEEIERYVRTRMKERIGDLA